MSESRPLTSIATVLWGMATFLCTPLWAADEPLRDPTRPNLAGPVVTAAAAAPVFKVTAIFLSERRRVAVVNGKLVAEGDTVDGGTVTAVQTGAIRIQQSRQGNYAASPRDDGGQAAGIGELDPCYSN